MTDTNTDERKSCAHRAIQLSNGYPEGSYGRMAFAACAEQIERNQIGTPAPAVTVKPLEWSEGEFDMEAVCLGLEYHSYESSDGWWTMLGPDGPCVMSDTRDNAKKVAQTDYERRILSAIQPEAPNARAYDLAYAIAGGEDAPGLLDSIPTGDLVKMIRDERAQQNDWNDATAKMARAEALQEAKPKTWGEMTDAEKGALLMAHHEGRVIQHRIFPHDDEIYPWQDSSEPMFNDIHAYRIKPTPVRETATVQEVADKLDLRFQDIGTGYRPPMQVLALLRDLEGYSKCMPCHHRAQNVMAQAAKLLRALSDTPDAGEDG